jgi:hypothetical protein
MTSEAGTRVLHVLYVRHFFPQIIRQEVAPRLGLQHSLSLSHTHTMIRSTMANADHDLGSCLLLLAMLLLPLVLVIAEDTVRWAGMICV